MSKPPSISEGSSSSQTASNPSSQLQVRVVFHHPSPFSTQSSQEIHRDPIPIPVPILTPAVSRIVSQHILQLQQLTKIGLKYPTSLKKINPYASIHLLFFVLFFCLRLYLTIEGQKGSVYSGQLFDLVVVFDNDYPTREPYITFVEQAITHEIPVHPV